LSLVLNMFNDKKSRYWPEIIKQVLFRGQNTYKKTYIMAKLVIFLVFYFFTGDVLAQSQNKIFDYIVSGNYEAVQQSFTQQVDICILSYEALVNKNEATAKLKEFFSKNKPIQYTFKHKGNSRANQSAYLVADLYTQNGMFRMFVYLSEKNGVTLVNEFRIEKS